MGDMHSLIQRILSDDQFRKDLAINPKATLERNGFPATDEVMSTIRGMDAAALQELARNYSADKAAC